MELASIVRDNVSNWKERQYQVILNPSCFTFISLIQPYLFHQVVAIDESLVLDG